MAPAVSGPDGGAAAAFEHMQSVALLTRKRARERSVPDPAEVQKREHDIQEEEEETRQRIQDVQRRVEEAAAQQEKAERELKPEDLVMPKVAIGPDGIPVPPEPHPRFAPVEILSIASTPEIKNVIKKANEKADSVGANLVGRDTWDLTGLHPRVMREGSNKVPGQKARAIVVTFTDFRPDGNEKNQKQAVMLINWIRWMKRHRIHCLVGVCQRELSIKARTAPREGVRGDAFRSARRTAGRAPAASLRRGCVNLNSDREKPLGPSPLFPAPQNAWVLLEEGWCVPFLATEKWAMENPKVGRWWCALDMFDIHLIS